MRNTYTIELTELEALAIRDAVTCMWSLQQGHDVDGYADADSPANLMQHGHAVADRLTELMRVDRVLLPPWDGS